MADIARNPNPRLDARNAAREQYWAPATDPRTAATMSESEFCSRCSTEFVVGSRFCYVCGLDRDLPGRAGRGLNLRRYLDLGRVRNALGLSLGALIAFAVGVVCVAGALLTGVMYTAVTMLEWQAVQSWRSQWLLAAIAAFVAGILLNQRRESE